MMQELKHLRDDIHDFYTALSSLIHGYKSIKKTEPMETLKKQSELFKKYTMITKINLLIELGCLNKQQR